MYHDALLFESLVHFSANFDLIRLITSLLFANDAVLLTSLGRDLHRGRLSTK